MYIYNPYHIIKDKYLKTKTQRAAIPFLGLNSLYGESLGYEPKSI